MAGKKSNKKSNHSKNKKSKSGGLNNKEKNQVSKMIKGKRETFFISAIQYAIGQGVATTFKRAQLSPKGCFASANRATMIGLVTAESFNAMAVNVNANTVHTTGQRLYLTGGIRARDLNGIAGANLDGDMGYMKSHLQRLKIHAKTLCSLPSSTVTCDKLIPLNFRVLVVQVNGNKPAGELPSMTNVGAGGNPTLFLDSDNVKKGIDDQLTDYEITNNLRVDTKAFKVVRDIKFKLSNPLGWRSDVGVATTPSGNPTTATNVHMYPATKEIDLWLPQPKKPIKFDEGTQLPTNYDYRYYTLVFCTVDSVYNNVAIGTTEDRWVLESTTIARVQEY